MPLLMDILRDYILEFEIKVERALANLRECLKEVVRDRDCSREIADTLASLEDELMALTRRFATLDHTWDEERAALETGKVVVSRRSDDLALELL